MLFTLWLLFVLTIAVAVTHGFLADDPYNDDLFGACLSLWLTLVILWVVVLVLAHCGYGEFGCVECTAPPE